MAITTQYGTRITDRVQISTGPDGYRAYFDGQFIGGPYAMGHLAVHAALGWLRERQAAREARSEHQRQRDADDAFLYELSDKLGCTITELERLVEIINRRKDDPT